MFSSAIWRYVPITFAFTAALGIASLANAEESGQWRGRAVLVVTSAPTVKVADASDHQVGLTQFDGIVFNDGGQPFLANARYQVVDLNDSSGMVSGGYKTFTADGGSQVFAKYTSTGGSWPTFNGEWTFIGGTQKYKGISGKGTFTITFVTDTTAWDVLEGDYKIP